MVRGPGRPRPPPGLPHSLAPVLGALPGCAAGGCAVRARRRARAEEKPPCSRVRRMPQRCPRPRSSALVAAAGGEAAHRRRTPAALGDRGVGARPRTGRPRLPPARQWSPRARRPLHQPSRAEASADAKSVLAQPCRGTRRRHRPAPHRRPSREVRRAAPRRPSRSRRQIAEVCAAGAAAAGADRRPRLLAAARRLRRPAGRRRAMRSTRLADLRSPPREPRPRRAVHGAGADDDDAARRSPRSRSRAAAGMARSLRFQPM
jgi:hypothetical protein